MPAPLGNQLAWRNLGMAFLLMFLGALILYLFASYLERYAEKKEEEIKEELKEEAETGEIY